MNKPIKKNQDYEEVEDNMESFTMSGEEMEETKKQGYNPFWVTKDMEENKAYKFKVLSNEIMIRKIADNFANGEKTSRMVLTVENIDNGGIFDLAAKKDPTKTGTYSSMTMAMRKLYALTGGKVKGRMFSLTKTMYKHEIFGDTPSFNLNLIDDIPE